MLMTLIGLVEIEETKALRKLEIYNFHKSN